MIKNKKSLLVAIFLSTFQLACTAASNDIPPSLNKDAFSGFTISDQKILLEGYDFKNHDRKVIEFNSCKNTIDYDINDIASHDYFRFKLLLVACKAVNKYRTAQNSSSTFFPAELDNKFYENLPALTTPFLSNTEFTQRENKSIQRAYKSLKTTSKNNTATLITDDDEIYITVLARGDFNNDKIEDLLVTSEWYAKHAHGKHTELVVLTKTGKDAPIKIDWRMNKPK